VDTFLLSFIFTGSAKLAGSIAGRDGHENGVVLPPRKGLVCYPLGSTRANCRPIQFSFVPSAFASAPAPRNQSRKIGSGTGVNAGIVRRNVGSRLYKPILS
jgi:hypothetical protein